MSDMHRMISDRAYALWEAEGRPATRAPLHWLQAEREVLEVMAASAAPVKPKRAPRKRVAPKRAPKAA